MSIICVPNLKEIKAWEVLCDLNIFVILCEGEEEKFEKNQAIFRNKYLENYYSYFHQF